MSFRDRPFEHGPTMAEPWRHIDQTKFTSPNQRGTEERPAYK